MVMGDFYFSFECFIYNQKWHVFFLIALQSVVACAFNPITWEAAAGGSLCESEASWVYKMSFRQGYLLRLCLKKG